MAREQPLVKGNVGAREDRPVGNAESTAAASAFIYPATQLVRALRPRYQPIQPFALTAVRAHRA